MTPPTLIGEHREWEWYHWVWYGDWDPTEEAYDSDFFHNPNGYNYSSVEGSGGSGSYNYHYTYSATWQPSGKTYTFDVTRTLQNSVATINEAGYVSGDVEIYTIGFDINSTGSQVLQGCATGGHYYSAVPGDLSDVFAEIGSEIRFAAQDVTVVDPMSEYVNLKLDDPNNPTWKLASDSGDADVVVTKGSVEFVPVGSRWKILWTISAIEEQYEADGVTPKGEKMTYFVTVDLTTTEPGQLYPSNEDTTVEYTDVHGDPATKIAYMNWAPGDFTVPAVSNGFGSVQVVYYRVNDAGQPVNGSGVVQPGISTAYIIDTFFFEDSGSTALVLPGDYTVVTDATATDTGGATYSAYTPGASELCSLTTVHPMQTVYFGFTKETYTITWNNWNDLQLEQDTNVEYGATPEYNGTVPARPADAQYTYEFDDWTPAIHTVDGNQTYTATYTATPVNYTVTFDSNGGTSVSDQTVAFGAKVTEPADPTKDGFGFAGWYTEEDPFVTLWDFDNDTMPAHDITLYAKWTAATFMVVNNGAAGSGSNGDHGYLIAQYNGQSATLYAHDPAAEFTYSGNPDDKVRVDFYPDEGWAFELYTETPNGDPYTDNPAYFEPIDYIGHGIYTIYIHPQWVRCEYTVTYDGNGEDTGDVPSGPVDYEFEETVTVLGNTNGLAKTGYTFDGWNTESGRQRRRLSVG